MQNVAVDAIYRLMYSETKPTQRFKSGDFASLTVDDKTVFGKIEATSWDPAGNVWCCKFVWKQGKMKVHLPEYYFKKLTEKECLVGSIIYE